MQVGDLVRLKEMNFSQDRRDILGIVIGENVIVSRGSEITGGKKQFLGIEYKVSIITNNKAAWYIEDSLELVNEGRRPC